MLSPRDPRFLELTPEEVEAEFWAHHYADNAGKGELFEDEDFNVDEIMERLEAGDGVDLFGADEWEDLIDDKRT